MSEVEFLDKFQVLHALVKNLYNFDVTLAPVDPDGYIPYIVRRVRAFLGLYVKGRIFTPQDQDTVLGEFEVWKEYVEDIPGSRDLLCTLHYIKNILLEFEGAPAYRTRMNAEIFAGF